MIRDYKKEAKEVFSKSDKELLDADREIFNSIESGSGHGFLNADMGHPSYRVGAKRGADENIENPVWGDSPENNGFYQYIKALHDELRNRKLSIFREIQNWKDFCGWATDIYLKRNPHFRKE